MKRASRKLAKTKRRANYKFTNKKHPAKAISSTILGCVSLFGIIAAIYLSFLQRGDTKPGYGLTGLLAVIFSVTGVVLGVLSFRERDSFYVLSWVGTILNALILIIVALLFVVGLQG